MSNKNDLMVYPLLGANYFSIQTKEIVVGDEMEDLVHYSDTLTENITALTVH